MFSSRPTDEPADVAALRAKANAREDELRHALKRLDRARKNLGLGQYIADNAALTLGGAFIIGLWLGTRD